MSAPLVSLLLRSWSQQREYAARLVADLSNDDMVAQPIAGTSMNHPAWIVGHLSAYPPALTAMVRGQTPTDPMDHPYGKGSRPINDRSAYPLRCEHLEAFFRLHDELDGALRSADPAVLDEPIAITRWTERFPTIAHACVYLMTTHEATHLGQLSAWRRAGGKPAV